MSLLFDVVLFLREISLNIFTIKINENGKETEKVLQLTQSEKVILFTLAGRIGRNKTTWIKQSDLARECQLTVRQTRTLLARLEKHNVVIISKIVTKKGKQDNYKINKELINYRKPTSPSEEMTTGSQLPLVPETTGSPLPVGCGSPLPVVQRIDATQTPAVIELNCLEASPKETYKRDIKAKRQSISHTSRFDEFYKLYPRKVSRQDALKKWASLKCDEIADQIISNVKARNATEWAGKEKQFIPHPATYLNKRRWEDEIEIQGETTDGTQSKRSHNQTRAQSSVANALDFISKH